MALLTEDEQRQVAKAIETVERSTDAELVTVLAASADDYAYAPLIWAGLIGLLLPGLSRLYAGADKRQGWILGYSSLTAHEIDTAMRRLSGALRKR